MTKFVDTLELSTRTTRVLNTMGVDSLSALMTVRRREFMAVAGAGAKSWLELEQERAYLRSLDAQEQMELDPNWAEFRELVGRLNAHMVEYPEHRTVDAGRGFLTAVRSDSDDGRKRMM